MPRFHAGPRLTLAGIPPADADWDQLQEFALSFDGYAYAGGLEACAAIARAPAPWSLDELRTALFFLQRSARHSSMTAECNPDVLHDARLLLANMRTLLAVRATSVTVPGIPVSRLILAIQPLPDGPKIDNPKIWYRTYKEFWLGWLDEYHGPGAYGRTGDPGRRDARFAYNHLVNPDALVWLAGAAGVDRDRVEVARDRAFNPDFRHRTLMQQVGAIRRVIPWETLAVSLWPGLLQSSKT